MKPADRISCVAIFVVAPRAYNRLKYANKKCNLKRGAEIARSRAARVYAGSRISSAGPHVDTHR